MKRVNTLLMVSLVVILLASAFVQAECSGGVCRRTTTTIYTTCTGSGCYATDNQGQVTASCTGYSCDLQSLVSGLSSPEAEIPEFPGASLPSQDIAGKLERSWRISKSDFQALQPAWSDDGTWQQVDLQDIHGEQHGYVSTWQFFPVGDSSGSSDQLFYVYDDSVVLPKGEVPEEPPIFQSGYSREEASQVVTAQDLGGCSSGQCLVTGQPSTDLKQRYTQGWTSPLPEDTLQYDSFEELPDDVALYQVWYPDQQTAVFYFKDTQGNVYTVQHQGGEVHDILPSDSPPEGAELYAELPTTLGYYMRYYIDPATGDIYIQWTDKTATDWAVGDSRVIDANTGEVVPPGELPDSIQVDIKGEKYTFQLDDEAAGLYKYENNGVIAYFDIANHKLIVGDREYTLDELSELSSSELQELKDLLHGKIDSVTQGPTIKSILDALNYQYSPAASGWLTLINWFSPETARELREGFGLDINVPASLPDMYCKFDVDPSLSQNAIWSGDKGAMPSLQLQALRSTPILFPNSTTNTTTLSGIVIEPIPPVNVTNATTNVSYKGPVLYYYKITLRLDSILDPLVDTKDKCYQIEMYGYAGNKRYIIDLDPGTDATHLALNTGTFTIGGADAIIEYWPVKLDRVCIKFIDNDRIIDPGFMRKLPSKADFCTEVVEVFDKWLVYTLIEQNPPSDTTGDSGGGTPELPRDEVLPR